MKSTPTNTSLREEIVKCFRDSYMQTEGETELFDTEETIDAIEALLTAKTTEARIDELEFMRDHMYNYYHMVSATMNDKEAIATFDYEFEDRLAQLQQLDKGEADD